MQSQYKTQACLLSLSSTWIILVVEVLIWVLIFSRPLTTEAWPLNHRTLPPSRRPSAYYVSLPCLWELQILSRFCKEIFHSSYKMRCLTFQQPSWMMSMSEGLLLGTNQQCRMVYIHCFCGTPTAVCSHFVQPCFSSAGQHISSDDQHYEVIPENTGICWFVWEHLNDVNHVLQHVKKARGTFSGWKMDICIPEVVAVGLHCTYEGRYPEDQKVQKILDWPDCNTLMEVCRFLGVCSIIRIWVKDFPKHASPLVILTK